MKKTKIIHIIIAGIFAISFSACGDEDIYPVEDWEGRNEGENYSWAHDDDGLLYCKNKSMDEQKYLTEVCSNVWESVAIRSLGNDLRWSSEMHNPWWWTGGQASYMYFAPDKCISFSHIDMERSQLTDAKWIYSEYPITWVNGHVKIEGLDFNVIGLFGGRYLDGIHTFYPKDNINSTYSYKIYQLCDDLDIDEVMKSAVTWEKLDELYYEWAMNHRQN